MIDNIVKGQAGLALQGAFPDRPDAPAGIGKGLTLRPVTLDILPDLLSPEILATFRPAEQVTAMAVPETAVNEDHSVAPAEYKVRFAGKVLPVQPKPESAPVKRGSNCQLRSGVLAFDTGHHPAPDGWRNAIRTHGSGRDTRLGKEELALLQGGQGASLTFQRLGNVRLHQVGHCLNGWNHNSVAELPVGLCVGYRDAELRLAGFFEPHQPRALARRQTARPIALLLDQDFRAVLVVTGGKGTGHIIGTEQGEPEAVPGLAVFLLVALKVFPHVCSQRVFRAHFAIEYPAKGRAVTFRDSQIIEVKGGFVTEAHNENPLALLGNPWGRADNTVADIVAQLLFKDVHDRRKGLAAVMALQIFHVLQQKGRRAMMSYDLRQIVEQRSLCIAQEAVRSTECVLLADARDGKRLTGETGQQNIMCRNLLRGVGIGSHVLSEDMIAVSRLREIGAVGLAAEAIPLGCKHASPANCLEGTAQAPDPGEQIDEAEPTGTILRAAGISDLAQPGQPELVDPLAFAVDVPADCPVAHVQHLGCGLYSANSVRGCAFMCLPLLLCQLLTTCHNPSQHIWEPCFWYLFTFCSNFRLTVNPGVKRVNVPVQNWTPGLI